MENGKEEGEGRGKLKKAANTLSIFVWPHIYYYYVSRHVAIGFRGLQGDTSIHTMQRKDVHMRLQC